MFHAILVPLDPHRLDTEADRAATRRTIDAAADLARRYGARLTFGGVLATPASPITPAPVATEYRRTAEEALARHARAEGARLGLEIATALDVGDATPPALRRMAERLGADLVVMATHSPNALDWLVGSNAASTVLHASCSVLVVR